MSLYWASQLSNREAFLLPGEHGGQLEDLAEQYGIEPEQITDFSVNVNPLGLPNSLVKLLQESMPSLSRYPDSESRRFRRKLARHLNLSAEQIIVGNGCSELIYLLSRCFQPEYALIVQPTFSEYERSILLSGGQVESYLLSPETHFQCSLDLLIQEASKVQMLFLCNPNNPTGRILSGSEIIRLVDALPQTLVVVDEAFIDFISDVDFHSVITAVSSRPNLIALRSMTKLFAIPGLRLGYLAAHPELVERLTVVKEPWTVNSLAQIAGEHLLDQNDYVRQTRDLIRSEREFLFAELSRFDWLLPYPTSANFFLVQIRRPGLTVPMLNEELIPRGLYVRDCTNFVGLDQRFFRIAVRKRWENQKLLASLREIESS